MTEEEKMIMNVHHGVTVPLNFAHLKNSFLVKQNQQGGLMAMFAQMGIPVFDDIQNLPSKPEPFLNGIKIGGESIASHDSEKRELYSADGSLLGLYQDVGMLPLPSGISKISLVSTDLDVTDAEGQPLPMKVVLTRGPKNAKIDASTRGQQNQKGFSPK